MRGSMNVRGDEGGADGGGGVELAILRLEPAKKICRCGLNGRDDQKCCPRVGTNGLVAAS